MAQALELRKEGRNYRQIAAAMRISVATAHAYVDDALREITRDSAENVLILHLDRYDQLLNAVYDQALEGDPQAIDRALAILARVEKLHGVESPREADKTLETYNALGELLKAAKAQNE